MATIGLSRPFVAKYNNNNGQVTYSDFQTIGKATNLELNVNGASDNPLYGDNGIAETDTSFGGGDYKITTTGLAANVVANVLGLVQVADASDSTKKWTIYDDRQEAPYFALGAVLMEKLNGVISYRAVILYKVKFENPSGSFATKGESIEWVTPELSGTILRSDAENHPWEALSDSYVSEAAAEAAAIALLGLGDDDDDDDAENSYT